MSALPFFVYTSKYDDDNENIREHVEKKSSTTLNYSTEIANKMDNLLSKTLFAGISGWINSHASEIGSLNVFVMCLAYELILSIVRKKENDEKHPNTDVFSEKEILSEFKDPKYNKYREYISEGKQIDTNTFNRNLEFQVTIYVKKIKQIIDSEEGN